MIKKVLILGGGSAGFITALTLRRRMPHLAVTVLRSSDLGIIGVGEGSTPALTLHLHGYLEIDPGEFYREAQPSWKLGIKFIWGKRPEFYYNFKPQFDTKYQILEHMTGYYCQEDCKDVEIASVLMERNLVAVRVENGGPYIGSDLAYHLENEIFAGYLERLAVTSGVSIVDDKVEQVETEGENVIALFGKTGQKYEADLFVDCSGFRAELLGKALNEPFVSFESSLLCDRALVGGWERTTEPIKPYTTAEAMENGWCWQIEHERRINRGYVYSSKFISDAAAEEEFRRKNPLVGPTRIVSFQTGHRARSWVGNVVAIGNSSGFVEPLEATALGVICSDGQALVESLLACGGRPGPMMIREYNRRTRLVWECIRDFLAVHYKFNEQYDNDFWRTCREEIPLGNAQSIVDYYREQGPNTLWRKTILPTHDIFDMDGYLCMLVGMQVPYTEQPKISDDDWKKLQQIRQALVKRAENGLSVPEAMAVVKSPNWSWDLNFYKQMYEQARSAR